MSRKHTGGHGAPHEEVARRPLPGEDAGTDHVHLCGDADDKDGKLKLTFGMLQELVQEQFDILATEAALRPHQRPTNFGSRVFLAVSFIEAQKEREQDNEVRRHMLGAAMQEERRGMAAAGEVPHVSTEEYETDPDTGGLRRKA